MKLSFIGSSHIAYMDESITFDDIHLNDKGYGILAEQVRKSIGI